MGATAVDLFAGAGGFSEAAVLSGLRVLWAANHNPLAVRFHQRAHPTVAHRCQDLQQANWSEVPSHDVLLASPCCQGHSNARGQEQPHHDDSRSTAFAVVSCAERHRPRVIVVENVPEFLRWTLYPAWEFGLKLLGYSIATFTLDAADFGIPQHRRRLFLVATRSKHPIELDFERRPHVPFANVVDEDAGWSPLHKPGRSPKTLARVANGAAKLGEPRFLIPFYSGGSGLTGRSLSRPLGTVTTLARWAMVDLERQAMRMLTVGEYRAAQSFRDDYPLPVQQAPAIKLLGNAVAPRQGAAVLQAVLAAA